MIILTASSPLFITNNLIAQNGILDSSFNKTGLIREKNLSSNSICTDKDNKTLVLGHDNASSPYNIYVRRYLKDGKVDSSFGKKGVFGVP